MHQELTELLAEAEALLEDSRHVAQDGRMMAAKLAESVQGIVGIQTDAIESRINALQARAAHIRSRLKAA
jgi:chaperonin cofactor prefoldin